MVYLVSERPQEDYLMFNCTHADKIVLRTSKDYPQDRQVRAYKIKKYIDTLLNTNNNELFDQGMKHLAYQLNNILYLDFDVYFNYRKYIDMLDIYSFKIILRLTEEEYEKYFRKIEVQK